MNRYTKLIFAFLILFIGLGAVYWFYQTKTNKRPDIVSISRFDSIFSKDLKLATDMANIPPLREIGLDGGDLEVRIWRAYSLPALEGVFLKHINSEWSGRHIRFRINDEGDIQAAEVEQLKTPESGWDLFFMELRGKGLMLLPLTAEDECDTSYLDGIIYVVEISENGTYRNYLYREGEGCRESKQMTEIGEIIGLEFDSGQEECKAYEWFACMTDRKAKSLASPK